jgi:hypothetical protein
VQGWQDVEIDCGYDTSAASRLAQKLCHEVPDPTKKRWLTQAVPSLAPTGCRSSIAPPRALLLVGTYSSRA